MRIFPSLDLGQECRRAPMFRVAIAALCRRIDRKHPAMRSLKVEHLHGDIFMAYHTPVVHGLGFPRCYVTGTARSCDFDMGSDSPVQLSNYSIERPRTKHLPATRKGISHNGKGSDQCGDNTCTGKTTQAGSSHSPLSFLLSTSKRLRNRVLHLCERRQI